MIEKTSSGDTIPKSVLMVCLGNICRSPMAEEVLRQKAQQAGFDLTVDSCGTGGWHVGEQADVRSRKTARARGYDIDNQRARQLTIKSNNNDFESFDLILAMDVNNLSDISKMKEQLIDDGHSEKNLAQLNLFSSQDPTYFNKKVPDPYYGNQSDFEHALDLIESMAEAWVNHWIEIRQEN